MSHRSTPGAARLRSAATRVTVALLVVALITSIVAPFAASAASSATVGGTVTDVDTGHPIANATVEVLDSNGTVQRSTQTNATGGYEIDTSDGETLRVTAAGYDTQTRDIASADSFDFQLGSTPRYEFTFAAGDTYAFGLPGPVEASTVGDLFSSFDGVIYGYNESTDQWEQVRFDDPVGPLDALVVVVDGGQADVQVTVEFAGTAGVDEQPPGQGELADGWNFVAPPQSDADAAFGEAERIVDQGYAEPQSQQVDGEDAFKNYTLDGSEDVRVNPFKGYFVKSSGQTSVDLEAHEGITRTRADGNLSLGSGGIEGTVTDESGEAVANVTVNLVGGNETTTATDGTYSFTDVSAGINVVTVEAEQYAPAEQTLAVLVGQTTTADLTVTEQPSISGQVTDANRTENDSIDNALVTLERENDSGVNETVTTAATNETGHYEAYVPANETYYLSVEAPDHENPAVASVQVGSADETRDFQLEALPGRITGTITNADSGDALEGVNVTVERLDAGGNATGETWTATTGTDGGYNVSELAAHNDYRVSVTADGYEDPIPVNRTVRANETLEQDFALAPLGYIDGKVIDSSGSGIADATVTIVRSDRENVTATTGGNGAFKTDEVGTGNYTVRVAADGYTTRTFPETIEQGANSAQYALVSNGTISGTVLDAEIEEPIPDGEVVAVDTSTGETYRTTDIDPDNGTYVIEVGGESEYEVTADSPDHFNATQTVQVGDGEDVSSVDFALEPENATIEGTVTDSELATDDGIANATVTVQNSGTVLGSLDFSKETATNDNGYYSLEVPAHGEYEVSVQAANHEDAGPRTVGVGAGEEYKGGGASANFSLAPLPGSISGFVTDAKLKENDAIEGASVTITNSSGAKVNETTTDQNGFYAVDGLPAHGQYDVHVQAVDHENTTAEGVEVGPNEDVEQNFSLAPLDGSISGTLTDSQTGEPIDKATVIAYVENTSIEQKATTNADGTYTITDVPAHEEYYVYGEDEDYEEVYPPDDAQVASVTVGANESVEGVALELDPKPANITGTVTDAELEDDDRDESLANVTVTVYESSALEIPVANDTTDENGRYKVTGVPADGSNYSVEFDAPDHENAQTEAFTPEANETVVRDASLEPIDGIIEGTVTDAKTGDPINASVEVVSEDGTQYVQNTGGMLSRGEYRFEGLNASKNWTITVIADGYEDDSEERFLHADSTIQQDFQLQPKDGTITGTVQNASNGAAIEGATVTVTSDEFNTTVQTNSTGQYAVDVVTPAEYEVTVDETYFLSDSANVQVDAGSTVQQDFQLEPAGRVNGTVSDFNTGDPLPNATVEIVQNQTLGEEIVANTTTDANGNFETVDIATGNYTIRFTKDGYDPVERTFELTHGPNEQNAALKEA